MSTRPGSTAPSLPANPRPVARRPSQTPSPSTSAFTDPNDRSFYSDAASTVAGSPVAEEAPGLPSISERPASIAKPPKVSRKSSPNEVFFRPDLSDVESVQALTRTSVSSGLSSAFTEDEETDEDRKYLGSAGRDSNVPPPVPEKDEGYISRPGTNTSIRKNERISVRKPVLKFRTVGGIHIELSPQPSDDEEDPLNWPMWRKNLAFGAVLAFSGLINAAKLALVPAGVVAARGLEASFGTIAVLTGLPLIMAAVTGLMALSLCRITGKRPIYLGAAIIFTLGSLLSMCSTGNLSTLIAGRFFTGLALGPFDVLLLGTIYDLFFEHERSLYMAVYHGVTTASFWLSPLIGGAGVANTGRFTLPFEIISGLLLAALPILLFGATETAFSRAWSAEPEVMTIKKELPPATTYLEALLRFIRDPPPLMPFYGTGADWTLYVLLRSIRAAGTPTVALVALMSFMPLGGLLGIATAAPLLFSETIGPRELGQLFTGAFLVAVPVAVIPCLYRPLQRGALVCTVGLSVIGAVVSFVSLMAMGLTVAGVLGGDIKMSADKSHLENVGGAPFAGIAVIFALLAGGVMALKGAQIPLVSTSAASSSASLFDGLASTVDMSGAVRVWENFLVGIMVAGMSAGMSAGISWSGAAGTIQGQGVGLGVTELFVAGGVLAAFWMRGEDVRRWDGQVLGLVRGGLGRSGSFFEKN